MLVHQLAVSTPAVISWFSQPSPLLQKNLAYLMLRLLQFVYPIAPNLLPQTTALIVRTLQEKEIRWPTELIPLWTR